MSEQNPNANSSGSQSSRSGRASISERRSSLPWDIGSGLLGSSSTAREPDSQADGWDNDPDSFSPSFTGFGPTDTDLQADEWDDESNISSASFAGFTPTDSSVANDQPDGSQTSLPRRRARVANNAAQRSAAGSGDMSLSVTGGIVAHGHATIKT